jgi:hypothetical protein
MIKMIVKAANGMGARRAGLSSNETVYIIPMTRVRNQINRRGSRSTPVRVYGVGCCGMFELYNSLGADSIVRADIVRKYRVGLFGWTMWEQGRIHTIGSG